MSVTNATRLNFSEDGGRTPAPVAVTWPAGCRWIPTNACDEAGRLVYYNPVVGEIGVEEGGQRLLEPSPEFEQEMLAKIQRGEVEVIGR